MLLGTEIEGRKVTEGKEGEAEGEINEKVNMWGGGEKNVREGR